MTAIIYTATFISQEKFFDDCQRSYLPTFVPVFGIYEDKDDAYNDVWSFINSYPDDKLELLEHRAITGDKGVELGQGFILKYFDKTFGGYALYELEVMKNFIIRKGKTKYRKDENI